MPRIFLTVLVCLAALGAAGGTAHAASGQTLFFETGGPGLEDDSRRQVLDEVQSLGARSLRVILYWRDVAPKANNRLRPAGFRGASPKAYEWGRAGRLIDEAARRGLSVLLTVTGPGPRWATKSRKDQKTEPKASEFRLFATAVGRRFGPMVDTWGIWNEPNHGATLLPQYVKGRGTSGALYRGLFMAAQKGLTTAGQGNDTILLGETAPTGSPSANRTPPLTFLRDTLCLDKKYKAKRGARCGKLTPDGFAHHPYSNKKGPFYKPPNAEEVTIGVISRLVKALDRAARARALPARLPIYLTEFGVQSAPDPILGVSLQQQAEYRSLSEELAFRNPRIKGFSQYLLIDSQPRPGPASGRYSGFESGLLNSEGKRKPAYAEFGLPLAVRRKAGKRVTLWGLVRRTRTKTKVEVLTTDGATTSVAAVRPTDARGVWTAALPDKPGRTWRVRWTAADGEVFTGPPTRASATPSG